MPLKTVAILFAAVVLAGCARTGPKGSEETAKKLSDHATTPEQANLWKEAAKGKENKALEAIGIPTRPVVVRQRVAPPNRQSGQTGLSFPQGVQIALRVGARPDVPEGDYSGQARVTRVSGDEMDLDLGKRGRLTLAARVQGKPVGVNVGDDVTLDYRFKDDPYDYRQIVAVKSHIGTGILSVVVGGSRPVTVRVPLFGLSASQVGRPDSLRMAVEIRVGTTRKLMRTGEIGDFPGLMVGLQASSALTGPDAYRAEGNPYSINLVAWPSRP